MVNYQLGKIYKVVSPFSDYFYVGSSCEKYLTKRFNKHKWNYGHWVDGKKYQTYVSVFEVLQFDKCNIILLENCPCNTKEELRAREQYYIDKYKDLVVNIQCAKPSKELQKKRKAVVSKRYAIKNKDKLKERSKRNEKIRYDKIRFLRVLPFYKVRDSNDIFN